jgi:hypothetical protein
VSVYSREMVLIDLGIGGTKNSGHSVLALPCNWVNTCEVQGKGPAWPAGARGGCPLMKLSDKAELTRVVDLNSDKGRAILPVVPSKKRW